LVLFVAERKDFDCYSRFMVEFLGTKCRLGDITYDICTASHQVVDIFLGQDKWKARRELQCFFR